MMNSETNVATREVDTFEEYTLYSLDRSVPTLLRMMERSKQVANCWPEVAAMVAAAGLCQEVAAMASFQETLDNVFQLGEMDDATGDAWKRMREQLDRMMVSMEAALSLKEPGVIKQIFSVELPETLNLFVEAIPLVSRHVLEAYPSEPNSTSFDGVGEES